MLNQQTAARNKIASNAFKTTALLFLADSACAASEPVKNFKSKRKIFIFGTSGTSLVIYNAKGTDKK